MNGSRLLAGVACLALLASGAHANDGLTLELEHHSRRAEPVPIPGGIQIPGGPLIHVFAPGPESIGNQGLDVEPNTITDFKGFAAVGFFHGAATDGKGREYELTADMRAFKGDYIAADGSRQHGTFGFV